MKKFLLPIIAFCLFLGLSACSDGSSNDGELAAYKAKIEELEQERLPYSPGKAGRVIGNGSWYGISTTANG